MHKRLVFFYFWSAVISLSFDNVVYDASENQNHQDEKPESVPREVAFFFPELPVQSLPNANAIQQVVLGKPAAVENIRGVAPASLNQV